MAHTKAKGSTKLGRDSQSKRLGLKVGDKQLVVGGQILIRQRGTKYMAGDFVKIGSDDTLYAQKKGRVLFVRKRRKGIRVDNAFKTIVSVQPE